MKLFLYADICPIPSVAEGIGDCGENGVGDYGGYESDFSKASFGALQMGQFQSLSNCSKGTFSTFSSY